MKAHPQQGLYGGGIRKRNNFFWIGNKSNIIDKREREKKKKKKSNQDTILRESRNSIAEQYEKPQYQHQSKTVRWHKSFN